MVKWWRWGVSVLLAASYLAASPPAWVQERTAEPGPRVQSLVEVETTARLLALLLDSGRAVINEHQPLLERPTSRPVEPVDQPAGATAGIVAAPTASASAVQADEFEAELIETFRSRSGVDLWDLQSARLPTRTKELLSQLLTVSKHTIGETHSDVIPAVFGSRVAARFAETTGVRLKQTALQPRNPANAPDSFERAALQEFANPAHPREQVISEVTAGDRSLRLMFPLYATRRCLDCHGGPKGQPDRMGYPREGLRLGQNAGAISVLIPLEQ